MSSNSRAGQRAPICGARFACGRSRDPISPVIAITEQDGPSRVHLMIEVRDPVSELSRRLPAAAIPAHAARAGWDIPFDRDEAARVQALPLSGSSAVWFGHRKIDRSRLRPQAARRHLQPSSSVTGSLVRDPSTRVETPRCPRPCRMFPRVVSARRARDVRLALALLSHGRRDCCSMHRVPIAIVEAPDFAGGRRAARRPRRDRRVATAASSRCVDGSRQLRRLGTPWHRRADGSGHATPWRGTRTVSTHATA